MCTYHIDGIDDSKNYYDILDLWNFFNPKAGILYKVNNTNQLYISAAEGSREPNRFDLLYAPSGNLPKPELMADLELGYKFLNPDFPLYINYYLMDYKNQLVLTGQLDDVGNPIKENAPASYRTGIEISEGFNIKHRGLVDSKSKVPKRVFNIQYTLAYSINKIKSFNEYIYTYDQNYNLIDSLTLLVNHKHTDISFSPDIVASLQLTAYPLKGLSISLMNKAVSKQYLDNTSNPGRELPAFFYSNLNITYVLPISRPVISLKLLVNNIFNLWYSNSGNTYPQRSVYTDNNGMQQVTPVSNNNYYFPQAGVNFLAGVSVRF